MIVLMVIAVAGFRWNCDADFSGYIEMYNEVPPIGNLNSEIIKQLWGEPGYIVVSSIFKAINLDFYYLSLFCVFCSILIKVIISIRLSKQAALSICLYFCIHYLTIEFIQIRWAVASSLLILGFYTLYRNLLWTTLLVFLMAVSMHYFSSVFILVALFVKIENDKIFYFMMMVAITVSTQITQNSLNSSLALPGGVYVLERTARYLGEELSKLGLFSYAKLFLYPLIYLLFYVFGGYKNVFNRPKNRFLLKLSLACISLTFICSFMPLLHFRAVVLADFFSAILVINLAESRPRSTLSSIVVVFMVIIFSIWYIIDLNNNLKNGSIKEYQTWVSQII
ncbi:EpsG family protein [Geothrix sp. PMB-07]|uniref:EpsG family protein n=1 Tax=Geothrix sp. PMB-07 TaxID=3068640 RepID=UPI0027406893|nr:EpsG family protein [Geothrix sp. PMB-07]WLT33577.1 EpsG family protein [Geothrix sp. PMB-07]